MKSKLPPQYLRWARTAAINVAVAGALAGVGLWIALQVMRPHPAAPAATPAPAPNLAAKSSPAPEEATTAQATAQARAEHEQLARENRDIRTQFEELGNWVLKNFKGKYPLPERMVGRLRLPPVTDDYQMHPDVAEVLQVTPQEKGFVDDALHSTWQSMEQIEEAMLTVTESAPGKYTLHIPSYAKQGTELREDLYSALEKTLGTHRFDRFMDVTQDDLLKQYHYFGAASRTVIFEVTQPQDPRLPQYLVIKDGWIIPDGQSSRSYQVTETAVNQLPRPYMAFVNFLPASVTAYAR